MNAPWVVTREEVNWQYELPFSLALELTSTNQVLVHWQGGALQHSTDLLNWTNIPNAGHPHAHGLTCTPAGFWRMRK